MGHKTPRLPVCYAQAEGYCRLVPTLGWLMAAGHFLASSWIQCSLTSNELCEVDAWKAILAPCWEGSMQSAVHMRDTCTSRWAYLWRGSYFRNFSKGDYFII